MPDVLQPAVADLPPAEYRGFVMQQQPLVHIFNIGIVVAAPGAVRSRKNITDGGRQCAGNALPPDAGLVGLAPAVTGIKCAGRYIANIADFIHLGYQPGPVGNALAQPEPVQPVQVLLPVDHTVMRRFFYLPVFKIRVTGGLLRETGRLAQDQDAGKEQEVFHQACSILKYKYRQCRVPGAHAG